jgi:hypothetical protein
MMTGKNGKKTREAGTMGKDQLRAFLSEKKKNSDAERSQVDWDKRLQLWQSKVKKLYQRIEKFLEDSRKAGLVEIARESLDLSEDYIGRYTIDRMIIAVGTERVVLRPHGTMIVGGYGRVDLEGEDGTLMLVLLPASAQPGVEIREKPGPATLSSLRFFIGVGSPDNDHDITKSEWRLAFRDPKLHTWPLTKESFTEALQRVMRK